MCRYCDISMKQDFKVVIPPATSRHHPDMIWKRLKGLKPNSHKILVCWVYLWIPCYVQVQTIHSMHQHQRTPWLPRCEKSDIWCLIFLYINTVEPHLSRLFTYPDTCLGTNPHASTESDSLIRKWRCPDKWGSTVVLCNSNKQIYCNNWSVIVFYTLYKSYLPLWFLNYFLQFPKNNFMQTWLKLLLVYTSYYMT